MKAHFCQSCGMPIVEASLQGSNADHSANDDYCHFCYQSGQFTNDCSLEEMIANCAAYIEHLNRKDGVTAFNREAAITQLTFFLPKLKRWQAKKRTEETYHEAVNRVVDYINARLFETLHLSRLSSVANLSEYHFHRIFKAITGESPGEYIQRLRLENIAKKLKNTHLSLEEIAEQSNYQNRFALSKAFKKHFGIPPSSFRNNPVSTAPLLPETVLNFRLPEPDMRTIGPFHFIYYCVNRMERSVQSYAGTWRELTHYIHSHDLAEEGQHYISIGFDDPQITSPESCRYYLGYTVSRPVKAKGRLGITRFEGGTYAVFRLRGPYYQLHALYHHIYAHWLPESNYRLRDTFSFEIYLKTPYNTSIDTLETEVYLPVCLKEQTCCRV